MYTWSLKSSFASLHPQLGPNTLSPVPTYTQAVTEKDFNIETASNIDISSENTMKVTASRMTWKSRARNSRCTSVASHHHCGFGQAEAFVDPNQEDLGQEIVVANLEGKKDDLQNLERTLTTTSVRSIFGLRGFNRSMKRRKVTFDADNIEPDVATKIDGNKILDSNDECDAISRKRHCGRRLKRLFTRSRLEDKDLQPHATLEREQPMEPASFDSAAAISSSSSYTGKFVFELDPDINFALHSGSGYGYDRRTGRPPLRKRDYLRQTLRFQRPRARAHPQLQNYQYHGVPVFNSIASPPVYSSPAAPLTAVMTGGTHYDLYKQYCKRSLMTFDVQGGLEAGTGTDGEAENGSTLYETSQTEFSSARNSSSSIIISNNTAGQQVYPGEAGKPLFFTGAGLTAAPADEGPHGVKKSVNSNYRYQYGSNNAICVPCNFHANVEAGPSSADGAESRTVSKYFPSPDPSGPVSPNPYSEKFPGVDDDVEILSLPSNQTSRSVSAASELALPPLAALTNTLGRSGLGIEAGTTKSINYHGTMRFTAPPDKTGVEAPEFCDNNDPVAADIYRHLRPPVKLHDQWI
jgi:hypothetical protein